MEAVMTIVMFIYGCAVLFLLVQGFGVAYLSYQYSKHQNAALPESDGGELAETDLPRVTVQLPIFNEKYVISRLIDVVADFDYPKDRFEIQVLDDSDDETSEIVAEKVKDLAEKGYNIAHIQRPDRTGYKAGALKYGTERATGELIAIFDADFIPNRDFLKRTVPQFANEKLAMVQTRWAHLNANYSFLTRLLGFALDFHFSVEQVGRNVSGHLIHFNGTAGVWRKSAILDAGGWQADTLTEDLDLSYRAQVKGWEMKFREEITSPAELPVTIGAIKSQQFRWVKGGAENARKNLRRVFSSGLSLGTKYNAAVHLLIPLLPVSICYILFSSAAMLFYYGDQLPQTAYREISAILPLVSVLYIVSYWIGYSHRNPGIKFYNIIQYMRTFIGFAAVFMSLSILLSRAALEGLASIKSPFVRTPKFNIVKKSDKWFDKLDYAGFRFNATAIFETLAALILLAAAVFAFSVANYSVMLFFLLPAFGFMIVTYYNINHGTA